MLGCLKRNPRSSALLTGYRAFFGKSNTNIASFRSCPRTRDRSLPTGSEYEENHEFYRYSSGRWLWNEEQQHQDRYRRFNIAALQRVAAESVGAESCIQIEKLAEGSYNKVFKLTMNDGRIVTARIPNPNAGPAGLATASEAATLEFVSSNEFFA